MDLDPNLSAEALYELAESVGRVMLEPTPRVREQAYREAVVRLETLGDSADTSVVPVEQRLLSGNKVESVSCAKSYSVQSIQKRYLGKPDAYSHWTTIVSCMAELRKSGLPEEFIARKSYRIA